MPTPATLNQSDSALESAESIYYEVNPSSGETQLQIVGKSRVSIPLPIDVKLSAISAGVATFAIGSGIRATASSAVTIGQAASMTVVTATGAVLHLAAQALTDAGVTGTIAVLAVNSLGAVTVTATNTITYTDATGLQVNAPVASTGATFTRTYALRTTGAIFTSTNVFVGGQTAAFGSTQPTGAAVFNGSATAPVGAVTTSGAVFASTTVVRKIIADGTASNVET